MIPQQIEAMKLALEALDDLMYWDNGKPEYDEARQTITALEEALAQTQEPVATVESVATVVSESGNQEVTMSWWHEPALPVGTKLYTASPQRKLLTRQEIWNAIRPLTKSDEVCKALIDVSMDEYRAIEAAHGIKE